MCFPAWKIFGFDLSELRWSAFGLKSLMEKGWHLRRERVSESSGEGDEGEEILRANSAGRSAVLYQLAMILSLAAEAVATYSLAKYSDLQTDIQKAFPPTYVFNNDIINSQVAAIVPSVAVAFVFGTDFFFLAQYPRRNFPRWWQLLKVCFVAGAGELQLTSTPPLRAAGARRLDLPRFGRCQHRSDSKFCLPP